MKVKYGQGHKMLKAGKQTLRSWMAASTPGMESGHPRYQLTSTGAARFTAPGRYGTFYEPKISGSPASDKSISAPFSNSISHFMPLHPISATLPFQTFYYYLCSADLGSVNFTVAVTHWALRWWPVFPAGKLCHIQAHTLLQARGYRTLNIAQHAPNCTHRGTWHPCASRLCGALGLNLWPHWDVPELPAILAVNFT